MTTWLSWRCWTYFRLSDEVISGGRIVSYDLAARTLKYEILTDVDAWVWEVVEAKYDELWVDPQKRTILTEADYNAVKSGVKPETFVALEGQDPEAFFDGAVAASSTWFAWKS